MSNSVLANIERYQKCIEKYYGNEEKLLHYISKLYHLPVTVQHLQETGVGRTINSLRKCNGPVRVAAKSLVTKWKIMVAAEEADGDADKLEDKDEEEKGQEQLVPESKFPSPEGSSAKRKVSNSLPGRSEKKRRDHSPEHYSAQESERWRHNSHLKEQNDGRRKEHSPEKRKSHIPSVPDETPPSPDNAYENGHYSESDADELRIEDALSPAVSDSEPPAKRIHKNDSRDSDSDRKPSSSNSHKDSRSSSKHHNERKEKSSESSSRKSKEEKKEKSDKSHHRKHEKHKSKSLKEGHASDDDAKSSRKSHHSSSSDRKYKEREDSRSKDKHEKKSSSSVKIKQEKSEVTIKQEPQSPVKSSAEKGERTDSKKSTPSSSSSSRSEKQKEKVKSPEKDRHKHKKEERKSSQKEKRKSVDDDGVDCFSGASFGDVLGMMDPPKPSKKKSMSSPSTSKAVAAYDPTRPDMNSDKRKSVNDLLDDPSDDEGYGYHSSLRPSAIEEDLLLPEISPHYKPLPQPNYLSSPPKRIVSEDEALSQIISSKQQRTKVYSGNKCGYTYVPTLFEQCTRVLQDNIEALGYTGGVPYHLLKPVLERATAEQLHLLEDYNAYLIEDTQELWQYHCQKDFRNKKREEMETWRDMYLRCYDEREQKLKSLTSSIQNSMAKWTPVRKTKLAYVEGTVKPPRNIARKQAKFGIPQASSSSSAVKPAASAAPKPSTSSSSSTSFGGRQNVLAAPTVSVPNPRAGAGHSSSGSLKPKPKAPLMQKALQLVKNRYKR